MIGSMAAAATTRSLAAAATIISGAGRAPISPGRVVIDLLKRTQAGSDASGDRFSSIEGVWGSAFDDVLKGSTGHNTLRGGAGNDSLSGDAGDDRLYGDAGRDTILGSTGKDWLSGGSEADVFRWPSIGAVGSAQSRADVVRDFSHSAQDHLDLSRIDANALRGGNQAFAFIGKGEFTAAGQVRYEVAGSEARVFLNTDSDHDAEGTIRLAGIHSLKSGDFLL
jgi:Ca2+-binding RTX toxin-like protein